MSRFSMMALRSSCQTTMSPLIVGQREKALENLKKAKGMFQEMGMDYWLRRTQEVLERGQG